MNNKKFNPDKIDLNIYPIKNNKVHDYTLKKPIHPNLPDLKNNFVLGIISPRNSGKTVLYTNLIIRDDLFSMENIDHVLIFSRTIMQDKSAEYLRQFYEQSLYPKYDDSIVAKLVDYQKSFADEDRPKCLVILDDNVGTRTYWLDYLTTYARHLNTSMIFSSQAFKQVNKIARSNFTDLLIGRTYNERQYLDIYDEIGSLFGSKKYFKKMYDYATAERFHFLYVKLDKRRLFKDFTEEITNKFPRPTEDFTNEFAKDEPGKVTAEDDIDTDDIPSDSD